MLTVSFLTLVKWRRGVTPTHTVKEYFNKGMDDLEEEDKALKAEASKQKSKTGRILRERP